MISAETKRDEKEKQKKQKLERKLMKPNNETNEFN